MVITFTRKKIKLLLTSLVVIVVVSVGGFAGYRWWHQALPLISPMDLLGSIPAFQQAVYHPKKVVYGFLPYWNIKYTDQLLIRDLTHLVYFGVDLGPDGNIRTHVNKRELEPGWNKLSSDEFSSLRRQMKLVNKKMVLAVTAMDNDDISSIVNNAQNRQLAIASIIQVAQDQQFDGINIDFEYVGNPDPNTRRNFATFATVLANTCHQTIPECEMSIDIYADSAIKFRLWDLSTITPAMDHVMVMTYDYYRPSSGQAGPVAPLRGKCTDLLTTNCLDYDVTTSVADLIKVIPSKKLLLGIPFYGYEWQTAGTGFLANTYPKTGGIATYKRIQSLFSDSTISSLSAQWSDVSMSPYLSYIENGKTYQIHYEDARSLGLKLDLVNQSNLAGIGIWALGYEVPLDDLWVTIAKKI